MDILKTIKRLVIRRQVLFSQKAQRELELDGLERVEVYEAIVNARRISKRLRTKHPKTGQRERLYVILGKTYDGTVLYTKGKVMKALDFEVFYVLVSSKKSKRT